MRTLPLAEAVAVIPDGASLMIGGFMGVGTPECLIDELCRQGRRDLTVIANDTATARRGHRQARHASARAQGDRQPHRNSIRKRSSRCSKGELEVELVPQGTLIERIRAAGYGLGGILTPTGVGTMVEEGKRKIDVDGRAYLLETPLHADFALMRGVSLRLPRQPHVRADGAQFQSGDRDGGDHGDRATPSTSCRSA